VIDRRFTLDDPPFAGRTGRGVVVAVVDSGVHASHPHVGSIKGGVTIGSEGVSEGYVDPLGHGTAVAAAIHEKAPDAELLIVKVFDRSLATSAAVLAEAIVWGAENGARLVNLSLGTANVEREAMLRDAVDHAASLGAIVVSASEVDGRPWFPGSLPGVAGVRLDPACPRDQLRITKDEATTWWASGYPRPIPGVSPERNLSGVSFAVANVTGFLARAAEGATGMQIGQIADAVIVRP
jgi:subtilisin family serine protease